MRKVGLCVAPLLFLSLCSYAAASPWEVAVVFLGAGESAEYQADIDRNILELAQLQPGSNLRLTILRDFSDKSIIYQPEASATATPWDPLFAVNPQAGILIPGNLEVIPRMGRPESFWQNSDLSARFFTQAFRDPNAKRVLIFWGHGLGLQGMQNFSLPNLRVFLDANLPKRENTKAVDILWLDACFMATVEVAYELKEISNFLIASEAAEFSAGAPFQTLRDLQSGPEDIYSVAKNWAQDFLESYSFLRLGSQREAVETSAATVSVVDLARIENLAAALADLVRLKGNLSGVERRVLQASASERSIELTAHSDLVLFLKDFLRMPDLSVEVRAKANEILRLLDGARYRRVATNQRVRVYPPAGYDEAYLVFGYHDWVYGYQEDEETRAKLAEAMRARSFVLGPMDMHWPVLLVREPQYLLPFAVDRNLFHFYFIDPKTLEQISPIFSFMRRMDRELFFYEAENSGNPVRFSGYTQGIGNMAERYFGMSIFDPSYPLLRAVLGLKFHERSAWGKF